jgi:hypothetical protein
VPNAYIGYSSGYFEPILWMLGLISLSWLTINLKKKTEEGHCQNPDHKLAHGHPYCSTGSEFHKGFYDAFLETLNVLTTFGHGQTPNVIEKTVSRDEAKAHELEGQPKPSQHTSHPPKPQPNKEEPNTHDKIK